MKIDIDKEIKAGTHKSPHVAADNLMTKSGFQSTVSQNVYDEVWNEIRVRCFKFYLVSDIPWKLDRVLKSYEFQHYD